MMVKQPNPRELAELIHAVRSKRKIEHDARNRVENAHVRLKLAIDSRSSAETRLFDYVSQLADHGVEPTDFVVSVS